MISSATVLETGATSLARPMACFLLAEECIIVLKLFKASSDSEEGL